ncbi:hypothetical protein [Kordiimonas marina]|uniref:hypothetical protein n=1 Tax=Kordiimonas marina TaxID=2872312 RepID=UPI001FF3D693|nr:hypothetical protein [Kordiimonas marina]MCJ9427941.1 hypothetical protein [Kordiimonas marina]
MREQATIIDFLGASLKGLEATGRAVLTPSQQKVADEIAAALDVALQNMVRDLEGVASCQQDDETGAEDEPLPPFEGFCMGMKRIGATLLPHLVSEFRALCAQRNLPTAPFSWIIRARADAFVAYLLQIAQVHGLALDGNLERVGKNEQIVLAHLGADLRVLMQRELDSLL